MNKQTKKKVVALLIVFIGALSGKDPPLNPLMMLWVNLIMDTMGALALGTEAPTMELLDRRPYRRDARLISKPMFRNIAVQSVFQVRVWLYLCLWGRGIGFFLSFFVSRAVIHMPSLFFHR